MTKEQMEFWGVAGSLSAAAVGWFLAQLRYYVKSMVERARMKWEMEQLTKERDELKAENKELKEENKEMGQDLRHLLGLNKVNNQKLL